MSLSDFSLCVVCNSEFDSKSTNNNDDDDLSLTPSLKKKKDKKKKTKDDFGHGRILRTFHKYLFFRPSSTTYNNNNGSQSNTYKNRNDYQEESQNFKCFCDVDGILPLPFCPNCQKVVVQLYNLQEQLESIEQDIQKTVAKISSTIVSTENGQESKRSDRTNSKEAKARTYRRRILQCLNPRVSVVDYLSSASRALSPLDETTTSSGRETVIVKIEKPEVNSENSLDATNQEQDLDFQPPSPFTPNFDNDSSDNNNDDDDNDNDADYQIESEDNYENEDLLTMLTDPSIHEHQQQKLNNNTISDNDMNFSESEESPPRRKKGAGKIKKKRKIKSSHRSKSILKRIRTKRKLDNEESETLQKRPRTGRRYQKKEVKNPVISVGHRTFLYDDRFSFVRTDDGFKCGHCPQVIESIPLVRIHMDEIHIDDDSILPVVKANQNYVEKEGDEEEEEINLQENSTPTTTTINTTDPEKESSLPVDFPSRFQRIIMKCGDNEFLYAGNWIFHVDPDHDRFVCDTCSYSCPFYKRGSSVRGSLIAQNMAAHIKSKHMKLKRKVTSSSKKREEKVKVAPQKSGDGDNNSNEDGNEVVEPPPAVVRSIETSPGNFLWGKWPYSQIEGGFQCGTCPAIRPQKRTMTTHIKISHERKDSMVCELCAYSTSSRTLLDIHQASHSTLKRFVCEICGRPYKEKSGLRIHLLKIHNVSSNRKVWKRFGGGDGFRTVTCEKCGKSLTSSLRLHNHLQKCGVPREKVYKSPAPKPTERFPCPICQKTFATKQNLGVHVDLHNKNYHHYCDVCNLGFYKRCKMLKHKEEEHSAVGNPNNMYDETQSPPFV